jgi:hypothetical protein
LQSNICPPVQHSASCRYKSASSVQAGCKQRLCTTCLHLAGTRHLRQMAQQAETGDVRARLAMVCTKHGHCRACKMLVMNNHSVTADDCRQFCPGDSEAILQLAMVQPDTDTAPTVALLHRLHSASYPPASASSLHRSCKQCACIHAVHGLGLTNLTGHSFIRMRQQSNHAPVPIGLVRMTVCPTRMPRRVSKALRGAHPYTANPAQCGHDDITCLGFTCRKERGHELPT